MRTVFSKYRSLMVQIEGKVISFKNGIAELPDDLALKLIQKPGYSLSSSDRWKTTSSILIARDQGIGDVLFVSTVSSYIKRLNPKCHLTFATFPRNKRLLKGHPYIDFIEDISKLQSPKFIDSFEDFHGFNNYFETSERSDRQKINIHRVDMMRLFYDAKIEDWDFNYYLHIYDEDREFVKRALLPIALKKKIAVVTQATETTRCYPEVYKLIRLLAKNSFGVVVISPGESVKFLDSGIVDTSGKTSLGQMMALLEGVDLVITPDTGPLHIAGGLEKKIITFFNSFPPQSRIKYYKNCFAYYPTEACPLKRMPCMYSRCPAPCLKSIKPEEIVRKVREML